MSSKEIKEKIRAKRGFISDMDGVIYHGNKLLPGVIEFVEWMKSENKPFLFLTNSSERTPRELQEKMQRLGIELDESVFYTSALATASFLASQKPRGTAFIIGEAGLISAMYDVGYTMNNVNPDYVIVGDTRSYSFDKIEQAVNLVLRGARLIGTNPDVTGPVEGGIIPATKALMAPIELATGKTAYYVGKPNPVMMRIALKRLGCVREDTIIIGDRMDTDIIAGIESGIDTCLVLTGISTRATVREFPYVPNFILDGVKDIIDI
ncbi:MAG: HAD family hydrolase [Bacteroidales bacterium]|nr:HAD family hydrolase [Bacteroidales bacterium]